jgi:hypothetical protein
MGVLFATIGNYHFVVRCYATMVMQGKRSSSMMRLPLHIAPEVVGVLDFEGAMRLTQR